VRSRYFSLRSSDTCSQPGAYHLCNQPKTALYLAKRQESLGRELDSKSIIFKALVFQAINYDLLGKTRKSHQLFGKCSEYAMKVANFSDRENMLRFLTASKMWLVNYHACEEVSEIQTDVTSNIS
jgi:hypothetical protein